MGLLLCCFRSPKVDEEHEDSDVGQRIQQPNVTTNGNTQAGLSSILQDITVRCDNLIVRGAKGVSQSQVEPEPAPDPEPDRGTVLESNKLIPEKSKDCALLEHDECLICFEEYTSDNPRITTTCVHHYHLGCLLDWKERSDLCPVCSRVLVFEEMS